MMFDKDLQEQPSEELLSPVQFKKLVSTNITNSLPSPTPLFNTLDNFFEQFETSLEKQLYRHNANLIKKSIVAYLKYCTNCAITDETLENGGIFNLSQELLGQDNSLDSILTNSNLFNHWKRKYLIDTFTQFVELHGLYKEIATLFGKNITEDFLILLPLLLQHKTQKFKSLYKTELDEVIPRMERFWGDQNDQTIFKGGWNVYNEIDYASVKLLAEEDVETRASTLFFNKELKCLDLTSINGDLINEVSIIDKFTSLISFISANIFLSMAGICQNSQELEQFCLDLHYCLSKEGKLREEHLQKKRKSQ